MQSLNAAIRLALPAFTSFVPGAAFWAGSGVDLWPNLRPPPVTVGPDGGMDASPTVILQVQAQILEFWSALQAHHPRRQAGEG
jgi:hypothetical protein